MFNSQFGRHWVHNFWFLFLLGLGFVICFPNWLFDFGQNCWFTIGAKKACCVLLTFARCIINFLCNHLSDSLRQSFAKRINTSLLSDTCGELKVKTAFCGMRRWPQWAFLGLCLRSVIELFWGCIYNLGLSIFGPVFMIRCEEKFWSSNIYHWLLYIGFCWVSSKQKCNLSYMFAVVKRLPAHIFG